MRCGLVGLCMLGLLFLDSSFGAEQRTERFPRSEFFQKDVLVHIPAGKPKALLTLLPAGDIHSYSQAKLPTMLAERGVLTVIPSPQRDGLYTGDAILEELRQMIREVLARFESPNAKIAIGGFSAGGIGAVRFTQHSIRHNYKDTAISAVFAVDAPLDYERWYLACEIYLRRLELAGRDFFEDRNAIKDLSSAFGGTPKDVPAAYRQVSPLTSVLPDGGNARLLKETPIRVYIEPDLKWRLENWSRDVHSTNVGDATVIINILRLLGNKDAELITTSNAGFREGGVRNPHSWSIVDEEELAGWICGKLLE